MNTYDTEQGLLIARKNLDFDGMIAEVVEFPDFSFHVVVLRKAAYGGYKVKSCKVFHSTYSALAEFDGMKSAEDRNWDREAQAAIERRKVNA